MLEKVTPIDVSVGLKHRRVEHAVAKFKISLVVTNRKGGFTFARIERIAQGVVRAALQFNPGFLCTPEAALIQKED